MRRAGSTMVAEISQYESFFLKVTAPCGHDVLIPVGPIVCTSVEATSTIPGSSTVGSSESYRRNYDAIFKKPSKN